MNTRISEKTEEVQRIARLFVRTFLMETGDMATGGITIILGFGNMLCRRSGIITS